MTEFAIFTPEIEHYTALVWYGDETFLAIKYLGSITELGYFDREGFNSFCSIQKRTEYMYLPRSLL